MVTQNVSGFKRLIIGEFGVQAGNTYTEKIQKRDYDSFLCGFI